MATAAVRRAIHLNVSRDDISACQVIHSAWKLGGIAEVLEDLVPHPVDTRKLLQGDSNGNIPAKA